MGRTLSIIVIEDEPLLAMLLEDYIEVLGHDFVGSAANVSDAIALVQRGGFDTAILDINLGDRSSWPVADELADRSIPFIIATGGMIDDPPARHRSVRTLAKPYVLENIQQALEDLEI